MPMREVGILLETEAAREFAFAGGLPGKILYAESRREVAIGPGIPVPRSQRRLRCRQVRAPRAEEAVEARAQAGSLISRAYDGETVERQSAFWIPALRRLIPFVSLEASTMEEFPREAEPGEGGFVYMSPGS